LTSHTPPPSPPFLPPSLRFQKIETAMAGMEAKITQHKENSKALKPKVGVESLYKKIVAEAQKRR